MSLRDHATGHSLYSASATERLIPCPGSSLLHVDTRSDAADEGTLAHAVAALALGLGVDAALAAEKLHSGAFADLIRRERLDLEYLSDDMIEYVQGYVDFVRALVPEKDAQLLVEQRVFYDAELGLTEPQGGTADALILSRHQAIIVDLKYGRSPLGRVTAAHNYQLQHYALGVRQEHGIFYDFTEYRLIIYQPRIDHLDEWTTDNKTLDEFAAFSGAAAKKVLACQTQYATSSTAELYALGLLNAGPKQCRWCSAKVNCPAHEQLVAEITGVDFEDLTQVALPTVSQLPSRLTLYMAKVDMIEHWCKAVRAELEAQLLDGVPFDEWKLVQGRAGPRKWVEPAVVEDLFKKKFRLAVDDMYTKTLITPTAAEKLLASNAKRWAQVAPHISRAAGGLSVAPMSDKRLAVDVKALNASDDDFENILTAPA